MIRYVSHVNMGTGYTFSFWNTVTDKFLEFSGNQAWDSRADFIDDYDGDKPDRYLSLIPQDVP